MSWLIFRHSKRVGPAILTISKRGLTTSIGNRAWRGSIRTDGATTSTARIPGKGIYWRRSKRL